MRGMINRRLFLGHLLKWTGLLFLSACRPAVSIPYISNPPVNLLNPRPVPIDEGVFLRKVIGHEEQIGERHLTPEGLIWYEAREEEPPIIGFSDVAIWTGCYVAAEALRWAETKDPEARERLVSSLGGLHHLQHVTGKKGLLARSFRRGTGPSPEEGREWHQGTGDYKEYRWLGDVSVDQVDGVFFGYALAFDLLEDSSIRHHVAEDVAPIADHILENRMKIIDLDGQPTRHGDLGSGPFSEDLNALIALMVIKVAHHITKEPRFHQAYQDLIKKKGYHYRAAAARDKWWEYLLGINHSDNNLAFLAFYTLIRLEEDPSLLKIYKAGLRRAWKVVRYEGNPLFTFVYHSLLQGDQVDQIALDRALETLYYFPAEKRNILKKNSLRPEICRSFWKDRHGDPQACIPLPIQDRPSDSFEWKANPYRLDSGGDGKIFYAGVDYLLPYWMGRYHHLLGPSA